MALSMHGRVWSSKDRFCSLYSAGIVFGEQNVRADIDVDHEPSRIDRNLHDTHKWFPFFTTESPQDDSLNYRPTARR
jgi:hypothetical protein